MNDRDRPPAAPQVPRAEPSRQALPAKPASAAVAAGAVAAPVTAFDDVNAPTVLHQQAQTQRPPERVRLASAQWSADPSAASGAASLEAADPTERVTRTPAGRPRAVELLDSGVFARPAGDLGDGISVDRRDDDAAALQATDPVLARPPPRDAVRPARATPTAQAQGDGVAEPPTAEVRADASTVVRWPPPDAHEPSWSVIEAQGVEHEHEHGHGHEQAGDRADYAPINARDVDPDTVTDRDRMAPLEEKLSRAVELADTLGVLLQGLPQPQRTASAHMHRELRLRLVEAQALLLRR